jgi:anhydro-N-acetylmuramic acid kinase
MRVIGLMSGTSLDGIDAALVRFDGDARTLDWSLDRFRSSPYDPARRASIHDAITNGDARSLCRLNADLGEWFARAVIELCVDGRVSRSDIALIGSHGQTIWHEPETSATRGATLQLGCAATIAERTGIRVVSDFRSRDVAAGGQGAPLVPFADRLLYAHPERTRILLNVGGMANLTRVPRRGDDAALLAFDTGPGNALIDAAVELATDGAATFDAGGERAAAGEIDHELLDSLLSDPWLAQPPPKSTGRERYGRGFVRQLVDRRRLVSDGAWNALIATLTRFTAASVVRAVERFVLPQGADELVITGGGARNPVLVHGIAQGLDPLPVRAGRDAGIDSDAKEAVAFAALAWAHVHGIPGNVPEVTGAAGPRILGSITPA